MNDERLTDDVLDCETGIERAERILEDHSHLAAQRLHLLLAIMGNFDPFTIFFPEPDLASSRVVEPQDRPNSGGFATATPSTDLTYPTTRCRRPSWIGKYCFRPFTSRIMLFSSIAFMLSPAFRDSLTEMQRRGWSLLPSRYRHHSSPSALLRAGRPGGTTGGL